MPRKQNGFGSNKSFAFKPVNKRLDSKKPGAPGTYPSVRTYGSSVHRTVIEKYNLDSNWIKWRKGYEYYNQAAWYRLQDLDEFSGEYKDAQIKSKLYQGTDYEVDVVFDGYKFATKNADSNNHYVMKRTTVSPVDLGTITAVYNDPVKYPEYKANKELRVQGNPGADSRLLLQMIGERITDGETEATLNYLLNANEHPALYIGKSGEQLTELTIDIYTEALTILEDINSYQDLVGKIAYIKNFYVEKPIDQYRKFEFVDDDYTFTVNSEDFVNGIEVEVLDPGESILPPSLYDIATLKKVISATDSAYTIKGSHIYQKDRYQKYFGKQYLSADVVEAEVQTASYTVMPVKILGVQEVPFNSALLLNCVPFVSEQKLYATLPGTNTLIFADWSCTKTGLDEYNGEYYHKLNKPGDTLWQLLDTDVDPWMDEVFTTGNPLKPATIYTCSCPNHSHSLLRAPQSNEDEGTRKVNRQRRYPLPTVMGKNDYDAIGLNKAAGIIESWETREHRMSFKMCKHSIAAMFIEKIKVKEPNSYPTIESREAFEKKLADDIAEVVDEFRASYKRGGITALEVVFALAQGLNLDDVETAYVVLNSTF